jgi:hypothetical protein
MAVDPTSRKGKREADGVLKAIRQNNRKEPEFDCIDDWHMNGRTYGVSQV